MQKPPYQLIAILLCLLLIACNPVDSTQVEDSPTPINPSPTLMSRTTEIEPTSLSTTKVLLYFIAEGDNGRSGKLIGCNDSVIPVEFEIQPKEDPIKAALELLFSFKDQQVEPVKLYNALYQSNLVVNRVDVNPSGEAEVWLSGEYLLGGVCDNPRFKAQIEETVLNFDQVSSVKIYINEILLDDILSGK